MEVGLDRYPERNEEDGEVWDLYRLGDEPLENSEVVRLRGRGPKRRPDVEVFEERSDGDFEECRDEECKDGECKDGELRGRYVEDIANN